MGRFGFYISSFLFVLLDVYSFYELKGLLSQGRYSRIYTALYFAISAFGYFCIVHLYQFMSNGVSGTRSELFNFTSGFLLTLFITKLVFSIFLITQDGGRAIIGLIQYVKSLFGEGDTTQQVFIPERRAFITNVGAVVAAIPFFGMLYGITKGKYQYTVEKITLTFRDLPKAFDGFKLVQISDIHAGSFDNRDKVLEGILKINALDPDIVCFTGDLVNSEKEEIDPYIDIFGQIQAKYGKFASWQS
ncbi:MAG: metallophosphoesterase [Saprospiraceae bacterium]|nr:metallophosphoesterase [Saprospiraceae bacterium]